jgi:hypothetical protein
MSHRSITFVGVTTLAALVALTSACSRDAAETDRRGASSPAAGDSNAAQVPRHSRLTGCLQQGTIAGTFVLTDADASEVGTAGPSANAASRTYPLVNRGDTDLTNYVGSRVTVSGRFQADTDAPAADRAPGVADRTGAAPEVRELVVEEIERTDGACASTDR